MTRLLLPSTTGGLPPYEPWMSDPSIGGYQGLRAFNEVPESVRNTRLSRYPDGYVASSAENFDEALPREPRWANEPGTPSAQQRNVHGGGIKSSTANPSRRSAPTPRAAPTAASVPRSPYPEFPGSPEGSGGLGRAPEASMEAKSGGRAAKFLQKLTPGKQAVVRGLGQAARIAPLAAGALVTTGKAGVAAREALQQGRYDEEQYSRYMDNLSAGRNLLAKDSPDKVRLYARNLDSILAGVEPQTQGLSGNDLFSAQNRAVFLAFQAAKAGQEITPEQGSRMFRSISTANTREGVLGDLGFAPGEFERPGSAAADYFGGTLNEAVGLPVTGAIQAARGVGQGFSSAGERMASALVPDPYPSPAPQRQGIAYGAPKVPGNQLGIQGGEPLRVQEEPGAFTGVDPYPVVGDRDSSTQATSGEPIQTADPFALPSYDDYMARENQQFNEAAQGAFLGSRGVVQTPTGVRRMSAAEAIDRTNMTHEAGAAYDAQNRGIGLARQAMWNANRGQDAAVQAARFGQQSKMDLLDKKQEGAVELQGLKSKSQQERDAARASLISKSIAEKAAFTERLSDKRLSQAQKIAMHKQYSDLANQKLRLTAKLMEDQGVDPTQAADLLRQMMQGLGMTTLPRTQQTAPLMAESAQ